MSSMANVHVRLQPLVICILSLLIASLNGKCPIGWVYFQSSCFMFSSTAETWLIAQASCRSHDGRLVEIYNSTQNDFLKTEVKHKGHGMANRYWLGGRDDIVEGMWQWSSSEEYFSFTDWAPGRPNNHNNEDCLALDSTLDYQWNDEGCHLELRYICERRYDSIDQSPLG